MNTFRCITMDPPWPEFGGGRCKRGADRHYPLIKKKEQILRVILESGLFNPDPSCHLWCWVTNNYLPWGIWLIEALGFRYVTNIAWVKTRSAKEEEADIEKMLARGEVMIDIEMDSRGLPVRRDPLARHLAHGGLGQYTTGLHELLLLGVTGPTCKPKPKDRMPSVILAPRGVHSEKPDEAYSWIAAVSPGPRLEMFARRGRKGWQTWGDEVNR